MRNRRRKTIVLYYVLLDKRANTVKISTTKQYAADYMGIHVRTINRNMDKSGVYENEFYALYSRISINKCKKGFAL